MTDLHGGSKAGFNLPANVQTQVDWEGGANPVYVGTTQRGAKTTDETWFIQKITWNVSAQPTVVKCSNGVAWDSRTTSIYT